MKRFILALFTIISFWICYDLLYLQKSDLANFDPKETAKLDGEMWRSYYEKKPLKLFLQMAKLLRLQMNAPFWRSNVMAYHAAKAAFFFKDGTNRSEYSKALPYLEKYYANINSLSVKPFNVKIASQNELEWWIIRREKATHRPIEWADLQAKVAAEIYQKPPIIFKKYAQLRTEAMFFRDQKGEYINESDWVKINKTLEEAWTSLYNGVN